MKKTITVVLDTNIYGWHLDYTIEGKRNKEATDSFNLISKLLEEKRKDKPQVIVYATETIEKEIKSAKNPTLTSLLNSLVIGIIKKDEKVEELAIEYYKECKKEKLYIVTIEDCEILASATFAGIKFFVTENRKTLNNPKVKGVFLKVNERKRFGIPEICDSKKIYSEVYA